LEKFKNQILYTFDRIGEIPTEKNHKGSTNEKGMWEKILFFLLKEMEELLCDLKAIA